MSRCAKQGGCSCMLRAPLPQKHGMAAPRTAMYAWCHVCTQTRLAARPRTVTSEASRRGQRQWPLGARARSRGTPNTWAPPSHSIAPSFTWWLEVRLRIACLLLLHLHLAVRWWLDACRCLSRAAPRRGTTAQLPVLCCSTCVLAAATLVCGCTLCTGLYGPLVGFSLLTPAGASASGPSPYCAPLTPPSATQPALLRHQAGSTVQTLSLAQSLLIMLEVLRVGAIEATSKMDKADKDIETEVGTAPRLRPRLAACCCNQLCLLLHSARSGPSCLAATETAS